MLCAQLTAAFPCWVLDYAFPVKLPSPFTSGAAVELTPVVRLSATRCGDYSSGSSPVTYIIARVISRALWFVNVRKDCHDEIIDPVGKFAGGAVARGSERASRRACERCVRAAFVALDHHGDRAGRTAERSLFVRTGDDSRGRRRRR